MLGIVIPIYNESAVLEHLYSRLKAVMDTLDMPATVCLVDDGSADDSLEKMKDFARRDKRFRYLSFSRNFGHQIAILAGLRELDASVYVIMDGDLQDPPEIIPDLLKQWRANHQVVYCVRKDRQENFLLRGAYALFYRILRSVSYLSIPLDTGDFCLIDRCIVDHMRSMREHNPFLRGLRTWIGYRQIGYAYSRSARTAGHSKYTLRKLLNLAYDGVISFSFAPLKVIINFGLVVSMAAFIAICVLIYQKLFHDIPVAGWTSLAVLVLFMGGLQLVTIGIMGEYIGRIFDEVKGRPLYIVRETNVKNDAPAAPAEPPVLVADSQRA